MKKVLKRQTQELSQSCEAKLDEMFIENSQDDIANVIYTFLVRKVPQGISSIQALIKHMQSDLVQLIFNGDLQKFKHMCENGVLIPILSNYAAQLTSKIEGFEMDDRIFAQ